MKLLTISSGWLALSLSSISFAFFCPTNFNQINFGDTLETVKNNCGQPATEKTITVESDNIPQAWSYFVTQTVPAVANGQGQSQGTLKMTVVFDDSGHVVSMSVNGIGVGSTEVCGPSIQLGDTRDAVKTACGQPSFIEKGKSSTPNASSTIQKTTLLYSSNPPQKLIFENNLLKAVE